MVVRSNDLRGAVCDHFNDIQRGNYHANLPNVINTNPHGRSNFGGRGNGNGGGIANSPMDQFEINSLFSINTSALSVSLTNIGLYLTIAGFICLTLNFLASNYNKVIANN